MCVVLSPSAKIGGQKLSEGITPGTIDPSIQQLTFPLKHHFHGRTGSRDLPLLAARCGSGCGTLSLRFCTGRMNEALNGIPLVVDKVHSTHASTILRGDGMPESKRPCRSNKDHEGRCEGAWSVRLWPLISVEIEGEESPSVLL